MQEDTQRIDDSMVLIPNPKPVASVNQRRSQRLLLSIPLLVKDVRTNGAPFSERTKTLVVNAHAGLIMLHEPVLTRQVLTLGSVASSEDIICTVIDINAGSSGTPEVVVEFASHVPVFGEYPSHLLIGARAAPRPSTCRTAARIRLQR